MIPWTLLDTASVPGGGELRLWRRGAEFSIRLGRDELMNSRIHGSEELLASLACARIADRSAPRILVGGLGMGFTLRAALDALGSGARVVVAELMPAVAVPVTLVLKSVVEMVLLVIASSNVTIK